MEPDSLRPGSNLPLFAERMEGPRKSIASGFLSTEESACMPDKKTVLITGVTHGLGRAMAEEFVRRGHTVLGCGRSHSEIHTLGRKFGKPHDFRAVDVSSDDAVHSWASACLAACGPPDLLLNNAGVINHNAPLWEISAREFSEVLDVNVKGTANVLRHFLPAMVKRKSGVIVNFSSGWGRSTAAEVAPYCASKWAVEGLTQALAQELPAGMAAIPLNPGIIHTQMLQSCFGTAAATYPSPAEWAEIAVPFLLKLGQEDNGRPMTVPIRGAED
jgi:NAD(P)-dependent dehydrogenase (short-subunit alcohol dehydrogenase family)